MVKKVKVEAMTEVSCGTIKWTYHYEVKDWVSGRTISWGYLLEVKQKYQVELSGRSTIWKQWQRYQIGLLVRCTVTALSISGGPQTFQAKMHFLCVFYVVI